jgi:hypothetical protein
MSRRCTSSARRRPALPALLAALCVLPALATPLAGQASAVAAAPAAPPDSAAAPIGATTRQDSSRGKDSVAQADSAPPVPAIPKAVLSGAVTASYTYSTKGVGNAVVGRLYDRFQNEFALNAAELIVDVPVDPKRVSAGVHAAGIVGQDAAVVKSTGLDLGAHGDLLQGFATLNVPLGTAGDYLQFKAGKIATLMGVEVLEAFQNPNLSEGNQFIYVENFTNTGLRVDVKPNAVLDAEAVVFNGWDQVSDVNTRKSFMGRVGIAPDAATSVALLGFVGPEQPNNNANKRYGAEGIVTRKLGPKLALMGQFDWGEEQGARLDGRKARWAAYGVWATYDLLPVLNVAVRGDYVDDKDGARSTAAFTGAQADERHQFGSGTLTVNIKVWGSALLRPEIRYDRSSLVVFDGSKDQLSFGIGASYLF